MRRRALSLANVLACGCGRIGFDQPASRIDGGVDIDMGTPLDACALVRTWDLVPDGDFETDIFPTWIAYDDDKGVATQVTAPIVAGANAARLRPIQSGLLGYSIGVDVPVTPGNYVLSGFLNAEQVGADESYYLDLDDVPFDPDIQAVQGAPGWQFLYQTVTVPSAITLRVRVVHDGMLDIGQSGFADEIAFTPEASFQPFTQCM